MSDFLENAKTRRSVRTFDGNNVESEMVEALKKYAETVKNPYNVEVTFDFLMAEENNLSSPVLSGEKLYVTAKMKKGLKNAEEAYGYSFEALLMHAHEMGLGTVWIGGTMPREKFEAAAKVAADEIMPCVSPIGVAAERMSIKESLMRKGVKADFRMKFEELFFDGDFDTPLTEAAAKEKGTFKALEAVKVAPSAVNKQPWRVVIDGNSAHFYEKKDKGFVNEFYDLQRIDVGIGMYHFERQMRCDGYELALVDKNPNIKHGENVEYVATYSWK